MLAWSERAVRVTEVPAGGPADRAGLRAGDIILAIDRNPVAGLSSEQVRALLSGEVGSSVELEVERGGEHRTLRIERAPYTKRKKP